MRRAFLLALLLPAVFTMSACDYVKARVMRQFIGPARYFDMSEIKDPSTLDVMILKDQILDSIVREGKKVRVIELTFVSQRWHESVWSHPARIYIPADYKGEGDVAIIGAHKGFFGHDKTFDYRRTIPGSEKSTEAQFVEAVALDLGTPIMIFATPGGAIFGYDESDLMGHALKEMQKTKDLTWFPYIPITTSYLRAITLMQSIPEIKARRAVLLGCSKRGYAVCISTGVDPDRVAGVMSTCFYGGNILYEIATKFASFGPGVRGPAQKRMGPGFQPAEKVLETINSPAGFMAAMAFDPYIWRDRIRSPYFVALGTNDEFYSLGAPNGMMEKLEGDKAFLYIDNMPHTWVSRKHLAAWRMWLAHCFKGRKLPEVEMRTERGGSRLNVTARVVSPNSLRAVRLFHSYNSSNDWRFAEWSSSDMEPAEQGIYTAGLRLKVDKNLAYYVEIEDDGIGGTGYISSLVEIMRR